MRTLIVTVFVVVFLAGTAAAESARVYPTIPGTNVRDYSRPGMVVKESAGRVVVNPTLPGTNVRDYSKPGMVVKPSPSGGVAYPTIPGTNVRDYSKPGWKIKN